MSKRGILWIILVVSITYATATSIRSSSRTGDRGDIPIPVSAPQPQVEQQHAWWINDGQAQKTEWKAEAVEDEPVDTGTPMLLERSTVGTSQNYSNITSNLPTSSSITVAVLGRSGTGVSSTISQLIGPTSNCSVPNSEKTRGKIVEYTISNITAPAGSQYEIKLLDIPGFVDGRTLEEDARILSSLKGYMVSSGFPRLFLAISRFDDNRMDGEHSLFVQFLRRVELMQSVIFGNKTSRANTAFLLTRLMSEVKRTQRRPQAKLREFIEVIQEYTRFPSPIHIVVGDNKAGSEYEIPLENGYYRLPNGEDYPKNVWQVLLNVLAVWRDGNGNRNLEVETETEILTSAMNNREAAISCKARIFSIEGADFEEDVHDFKYFLMKGAIAIQDNEVNSKLDQVLYEYGELDRVVQKVALQVRLQESNITKLEHIPKRLPDQIKFFQEAKLQPYAAVLLNDAFGLRMPPYGRPQIVGYGYDIIHDELTRRTPFRTDLIRPSEAGVGLPNFLHCRPLSVPEVRVFNSYSYNFTDYARQVLHSYEFPMSTSINVAAFQGRVKEGFNLAPAEYDRSPALSALKEVRTVKCFLRRTDWIPNPEFLVAVDTLPPLDIHNRDSVQEWNTFFGKFGSHMIVQAYGGGRLMGRVAGAGVLDVLQSDADLNQTLNSILDFTDSPVPGLSQSATYTFSGGSLDKQGVNLTGMDALARRSVLEKWEGELQTGFVMLNYEMELEPISNFVWEDNLDRRRDMATAVELLLQGQLTYRRRRRPQHEVTITEVPNTDQTRVQPSEGEPQPPLETPPPPTPGSPPTPTLLSICNQNENDATFQAICEQLQRTNVELENLRQHARNQSAQGEAWNKRQALMRQQFAEKMNQSANLTSELMQEIYKKDKEHQQNFYEMSRRRDEEFKEKDRTSAAEKEELLSIQREKELVWYQKLAQTKKETNEAIEKAKCAALNKVLCFFKSLG